MLALTLGLACASRVPVTASVDLDSTTERLETTAPELQASFVEGSNPPRLEVELSQTTTTFVHQARETTTSYKHLHHGKLLHGYWWTAGALMSHGLVMAAYYAPGEEVGSQALVWGAGFAAMGGAIYWTVAPALPGKDRVTRTELGPLLEVHHDEQPEASTPLRLLMGDREVGQLTTDAQGRASWTFPEERIHGFTWRLELMDPQGATYTVDLRDSAEIGQWHGDTKRQGKRVMDPKELAKLEPSHAAYAGLWAGSCERKLEHLGVYDTPSQLFKFLPEETKVVPECQAVFDALPEHAVTKSNSALREGDFRVARAWAQETTGQQRLELLTAIASREEAELRRSWGPRKREAFQTCRSFHAGLARTEARVNQAQRSGNQDRFDAAVEEARDWMSENQDPMAEAMEELSSIAREMEELGEDPLSFVYEVARHCDR